METYHGLPNERNSEATKVLRAIRQEMNVFMHIDQLQIYLNNPECLHRAATQVVRGPGHGNIDHSVVPLDL